MHAILIVMMLLILASSVNALGAGPSRKVVNFASGLQEYELRVINNEYKDLRAKIEFAGELAQYASVSSDFVYIPKDQNEQIIRYRLNLPAELKSGPHTLDIVVTELGDEGAGVQTLLRLISKLVVNVAYPDKYLEAKLLIDSADINEETVFNIQLFNLGSDDITDAHALIEVFALDGTKIAEFGSNSISLASGSSGKVAGKWFANVRKGAYQAVATVNYDGRQILLDSQFDVGKMNIEIKNVLVENFYLGGVAKFDIYLYNDWNYMLDDVYAQMRISQGGKIFVDTKTAPASISSGEVGKLEAFWQTEGINAGKYLVDLVVNYAGRVTQDVFEIDVQEEGIVTEFDRFTGRAVSAQDDKIMNFTAMLVIGIAVLIALNIYMLIYLRRRK